MPAEKPFNKYYRPGMLRPFAERQSEVEFRRRKWSAEFKQGKADVRSYPLVESYLRKVIDDFDERFGPQYTPTFSRWHQIRVEILDTLLGTPDYMERARALSGQFEKDFFTDPKTGQFDDNTYNKVKPVITEITYLVSRS